MPLSGVPGVLTSESGQGGDWLGVEAVVCLLPHRYLCPQTHPVSTAGVRVHETTWHLWGAQTPGRAMEMGVQEAVDKDEARPSHQPHSPPVPSLSQTASCLCLCFLCLHSSCRCCLVSGPFGKVQSICPEDSLPLAHPQPPPTLVALAFPTYMPSLGYPPSRTLVPIHVVVFPIPLHVRHRCHQIFQEVKLLLKFNALLPEQVERKVFT